MHGVNGTEQSAYWGIKSYIKDRDRDVGGIKTVLKSSQVVCEWVKELGGSEAYGDQWTRARASIGFGQDVISPLSIPGKVIKLGDTAHTLIFNSNSSTIGKNSLDMLGKTADITQVSIASYKAFDRIGLGDISLTEVEAKALDAFRSVAQGLKAIVGWSLAGMKINSELDYKERVVTQMQVNPALLQNNQLDRELERADTRLTRFWMDVASNIAFLACSVLSAIKAASAANLIAWTLPVAPWVSLACLTVGLALTVLSSLYDNVYADDIKAPHQAI